MDQEFDVNSMIERFRERAAAVRQRGLPPVEGPERQRILRQMKLDFQDFAMVGDAEGSLENGVLTLRLDLRPRPESEAAPASGPTAEGSDPGRQEAEGGGPGQLEAESEPEPPASR